MKLEIGNLSPNIIEAIRACKCTDAVSQENATHLRIIAHGDEAFDSVVDAVRANNGKINSVENLQPTLEDVFLHLTGHQVRDSADQKIKMEKHGPLARQQRRIR